MVIKTSEQLVEACINMAKNFKTLYVLGCFGAPMTDYGKNRWKNAYEYNRRADRVVKINAASADTFGADCVCGIKALLWGWTGDPNHKYGGVTYKSNGVPDIGADTMITVCKDVSTDFSNIIPGELLWMKGHVGVYLGDGLAFEVTPKWKDGAQITAVHNIGKKSGYNGRSWTKHGKLPYITYPAAVKPAVTGKPSTGTIADEKVIWDFLKSKGLNDYAVAGIMGNLFAESALRSNNLQQTFETRLGYNDATYTAAVDNGSYDNFVKDSAGYGLAQWTYWSRKQALLNYATAAKKSIGDLQMQLDFLWTEIQGYKNVMDVLKTATSVLQASNAVLTGYERPADQSVAVQNKRAGFGQKYYDKYAVKPVEPKPAELKIGDVVDFTGNKHYVSSNAASGPNCKPGKAKITHINKGSKHPYHLVRVSGGGSTVWGWVDATDIKGAQAPVVKPWVPAVGDIVNYNGKVHYTSANATVAKTCAPGQAKITRIYQLGKSKHPYHLVRVGKSGPWGWVDANSFTKA